MSKRRRKKSEESKGLSILSFVEEAEEKPTKVIEEKTATTPTLTTIHTTVTASEEELVASFLIRFKRVTKKDLIDWAKTRRIPLSKVFTVISKLEKEGKLVKRLNDKGELIYEVKLSQ